MPPGRIALEIIGPRRGLHECKHRPQDPVFVETRHVFQGALHVCREGRNRARPAFALRIEARLEQIHQHAHDAGVVRRAIFHIRLAEGQAEMAEIAAISAQHEDLARREARAQHQAVKAVVFNQARPDLRESVLKLGAHGIDVKNLAFAMLELILVDPHRGRCFDLVGTIGHYRHAHVLQHRQDIPRAGSTRPRDKA